MHILYATDGSAGAQAAARLLTQLPLQRPKLHLLMVAGDLQDGAGEAALTSAREALGELDAAITTEIRQGHAADEIIQAAETQSPDLLVLGSRGVGTITRFFLGSVAERVARHAPCPVLVARPPQGDFDRVVIGVDGSDCASHAADWLRRFPLPSVCKVRIVNVLFPAEDIARACQMSALTFGEDPRELSESLRLQAQERLEAVAASFTESGRAAETELRSGHGALGLLQAAEDWKADLVVVGSHGQSALERFLLGSVSEHVLRHAHSSVLIVREQKKVG